ncbi:tetratricopeptide repeat protein [Bacillus sp. FJAT-50079]|nr:tetratricopeptide repeat protein [Bacillus sp. FJAT-50079]MBS4209771.1 tetratricopeptide repeat protein [Bacillus sp. FJAT-50079]
MNPAQLMIRYIEEQNLQEAEKQFELVKVSSSDEEKFELAEVLSQYGFLEEARQLFELLLVNHPEESELKILLAQTLIEMDMDEEAYHYLESISPEDPNYPKSLLIEADLYEMQGLYEVSEQKLLQAKEIVADEPIIDYALAELYMSQGRFLEASRLFQLLIDAKPASLNNIDLHARMAEALSAGGAFEESLFYYENSLANQSDVNVLFGYGLTSYQAGLYQKALNAFKKLKEMDPDYHSLYLYLAKCYEHENDIKSALEAVKFGLELDEYNKDLHFYAGNLFLKNNNEQEAEHYFREALALDPEFVMAALNINKLLIHQERYEEVLEIIHMLDDGNADPQFQWDAAVSFQHTEQYSMALKHYELAYNDFKHNRDFLVDYGYFLLEEGKREESSHLFKKLLQMEPDNEEWYELLRSIDE